MSKAILALDLGSQRLGWACNDPHGWGSIDFRSGLSPKFDNMACDGRVVAAFYGWLMNWGPLVDEVAYENIKFNSSVAAAQCYGALRGTVHLFGEATETLYIGVKPQDVRKRLTGNGGAKKEKVWQELCLRGHRCQDLNGKPDYDASDALAVLLWRMEQ